MSSKIPYDYLLIIDLEATCDENEDPSKVQFRKDESEIIEFSWVAFDARTLSVIKKQQSYCKPENTPITPYCINLTKITPKMVEKAGTLQDAVNTLDTFIRKTILERGKTFCFVTHGPWDLKIQFPREAKDKGLSVPAYLQNCTLFDLKDEFFTWLAHHPEHRPPNSMLITMCKTLKTQLVEPQHSGINDCLTIGNIIRSMINYRHPDVFRTATDLAKIRQDFLTTRSNLVFFGGLPMRISQPEISAWLNDSGISFKALWMCRNLYRRPTGTGFAVLEDHKNALKFLELNGSTFRNRAVEVIPSTDTIFKNIEAKLSSWPGPYGILMSDFIQEKSRIVHLSEIPYKATQNELQLLFSANNLKPQELYLVSDVKNRSAGLGFAVFSTHHEAMRCMGMPGTSLNGRTIKLYPSNQEMFDMTEPYRKPFPAMLGMRRPQPTTFQTTISSSTSQARFMPSPPRRFHTFSLSARATPSIKIIPLLAKSKVTPFIKPSLIIRTIRQLCRK